MREWIPMKVKRWKFTKTLAWILAVSIGGLVFIVSMNGQDGSPIDEPLTIELSAPQVSQRGAYLVQVGNCAACHTARGGLPFAGGKGIDTPFGTVVTSNITSDRLTGIGAWTTADFWQAMHHGRSKDGRLLYPAFPYTEYTRITRDDTDAMFAYLLSVQPVQQTNRPHALQFPYNTQAALAVWRALFFSPEQFEPLKKQSDEWNRGAYLVKGVGHCQACHAPRNMFGATQSKLGLSGGLIPMQNWYASSLASPAEAGLQDWAIEEIMQLLKTGKSANSSTLGPMAEVVFSSTQHLTQKDLKAMAHFLKELPRQENAKVDRKLANSESLQIGQGIYHNQCAQCHGDNGEGRGDYPSLAGNRTVTMNSSVNLVRIILSGGFTPTTEGNPRPYGMPPFGHTLSDSEVAAVATYVRNAWGNNAGAVMPLNVQKTR
jgi:mono/diheme cytochrome c family protein